MDCLAIFQGPQGYITPSWYASKAEHGRVVPTWNYAVVHAHGTLTFVEDPAWLLAHLRALTRQHESHRELPWEVSDAPEDFVARQLRLMVGFEIAVEHLQGTLKMSQNKSAPDRIGVVEGLRTEGHAEVSRLVENAGRS